MKPSSPVCPVPIEQQPINEYQELSESWFFRWANQPIVSYLKPILILWLIGAVLALPVAAVSFPFAKYPLKLVISVAIGANVFPALALLRLWLGWIYVRDRLSQSQIFYEESGWYDGQTWEKPEEVLQRDRLIVTYQIQPLLKRLHRTFSILAIVLLVEGLAWALSPPLAAL